MAPDARCHSSAWRALPGPPLRGPRGCSVRLNEHDTLDAEGVEGVVDGLLASARFGGMTRSMEGTRRGAPVGSPGWTWSSRSSTTAPTAPGEALVAHLRWDEPAPTLPPHSHRPPSHPHPAHRPPPTGEDDPDPAPTECSDTLWTPVT